MRNDPLTRREGQHRLHLTEELLLPGLLSHAATLPVAEAQLLLLHSHPFHPGSHYSLTTLRPLEGGQGSLWGGSRLSLGKHWETPFRLSPDFSKALL